MSEFSVRISLRLRDPQAAPSCGSLRRVLASGFLLAFTLSSCAYYNTFYLARRYYDRATSGAPYPVEKADPGSVQNYTRAIDYSKKVIANYPKSKWVDDAYLMWARSLLGKDDPLQTVTMLRDFSVRYPKSPLKADAVFYLGVGYRQARKYSDAVTSLDEFLAQAPRHDLVPYAHLERSRALMSLKRPGEAAEAAGQVVEKFPKSKLYGQALLTRAEAFLQQGDHGRARIDFQTLGGRARTDEERLNFLLREADALEGARQYDEELGLLRGAMSHETPPARPDTAGGVIMGLQPGQDRYGRLQLRIGTAHMLAGEKDQALNAYRHVIADYPKTVLAAEAQYRIGYLYENVADDFALARAEYAIVQSHSGASPFVVQAQQRIANIDRVAQFRKAEGDSVDKRAEAGFLLAELYLYQLDKPERAVEEYRKVADAFPGTPHAAKALNAQAWVLRNKLDRPREADSLHWVVVRNHPATEAQLAARDYLESQGVSVPSGLIVLPEPKLPPPDTTIALTEPPAESPAFLLPGAFPAGLDTLTRARLERALARGPRGVARRPGIWRVLPRSPLDDPPQVVGESSRLAEAPDGVGRPEAIGRPIPGRSPPGPIGGGERDTVRVPTAPFVPPGVAPRDSVAQAPRDSMPPGPIPAPSDTVRSPIPAPPDTSRGPR